MSSEGKIRNGFETVQPFPGPHMTQQELDYLINHVFLPPKLPQKEDKDIGYLDYALLKLLKHTASKHVASGSQPDWRRVLRLINQTARLHTPPTNQFQGVQEALSDMKSEDVIAFHIQAQNAGLIVRHLGDEVLFEAFEVSPQNASVMGCQGRLICQYPGPAWSLPTEVAQDPNFIYQLASFVSSMSGTECVDAMPVSKKAGAEIGEVRDTNSPRYITEMLGGILRGFGKQAVPRHAILKHVRDDVLWKSCLVPWRRSPLWLVVRVALQSTVSDNVEYKRLILEFMVNILAIVVEKNMESDIISILMRKISRRANKVGDQKLGASTLSIVDSVLEKAEGLLKTRWATIQQETTRKIPWKGFDISSSSDTVISLTKSREYILSRLKAYGNPPAASTAKFEPKTKERQSCLSLFASGLSKFDRDTEFDRLAVLIEFESFVQDAIQKGRFMEELVWPVNDPIRALKTLDWLIPSYVDAATKAYGQNPECISLMILTVMEMWVEMDKAICNNIDIFGQFPPEIDADLFRPLLLSKFCDMERLHRVEEYLKGRQQRSLSSSPKILSGKVNSESFSVRYFKTCGKMQNVHQAIENAAAIAKAAKIEELGRLNKRHTELMSQHQSNSCNMRWDYRGNKIHMGCPRCTPRSKAKKLKIKAYEWPLPVNPSESKNVVFELNPPEDFAIWRKMTYYILKDVFKTCDGDKGRSEGSFDNIPELRARKTAANYRLTLVSTTKSWYVSHYEVKINGVTQQSQVCGNCAMNYQLYDSKNGEWAANRFAKTTIAPMCKIELEGGQYKRFQYAVEGTDHTPNCVIANQNICPKGLTLEEYHAFCSLRSGSRLQWKNILQELATGVLTFRREEVHDLARAAACQVGTSVSGEPLRDDHVDLRDKEFGLTLIEVLSKFLESIKGNWQEAVAAKTLILLANRLLSSAAEAAVISGCKSFLSSARRVTLDWTREVVAHLQEMDAETDTKRERNMIVHIAAICRMTFDVEEQFQQDMLSEGLATYLECGLYIHDNCLNQYADVTNAIRTVLMRDIRAALQLEQKIHNILMFNNRTLDACVKSLWKAFPGGIVWKQLPRPDDRWYTTETAAEGHQASLLVHFNILENRLLVNGQLFGRLPYEMTTHPTYRRLLGKRVLDIVPSRMAGMKFATKNPVHGQILHFSAEGENLFIRAELEEGGAVYELIPYEVLQEDFPRPLWKNMSHWVNLDTGEGEFRELKDWHKTEDSHFVLRLDSRNGGLFLANDREKIVDIRSSTMELLARSLEGIERKSEILISYAPDEKRLLIKLPRYKLDFFCEEGSSEIVCQTIPDHVVDRKQDIGAFIGLANMLVLRHRADPDNTSPRMIIVPHGTASHTGIIRGGHPVVSIKSTGDDRGYYTYIIDTKLGRLVDDGTLAARYTRIHLHALTAHCLPDPLTGRTGTVEALEGLRSEASFSFQALRSHESDILLRIATLTPEREYYPRWFKTMQTVEYDAGLPTLSQNDEFYPAVEEILQHWNKIQPFCGFEAWTSAKEKPNEALRKRAALRNRHLSGRDASVEHSHAQIYDMKYEHRHFPTNKESSVYEIANLVRVWPARLDVEVNINSIFENQDSLSAVQKPTSYQELCYDEEWLKLPVNELWINLYNLCRDATRHQNTYGLAFVLSSLLYGAGQPICLLKSLLGFATNNSFAEISRSMPSHGHYPLGMGSKPKKAALLSAIKDHFIDFYDSEQSRLPAHYGEDDETLWERRRDTFKNECDSQSLKLSKRFKSMWPCYVPSAPQSADFPLINVGNVMEEVKELFRCWSANKDFFDHTTLLTEDLRCIRTKDCQPPSFTIKKLHPTATQRMGDISGMNDLLAASHPCIAIVPAPDPISTGRVIDAVGEPTRSAELEALLDQVGRKSGRFGEHYVTGMKASLAALYAKGAAVTQSTIATTLNEMKSYQQSSVEAKNEMLEELQHALLPKDKCGQFLHRAGLWPVLTTRSMIETLQLKNRATLPTAWAAQIMRFGELLTLNQKAERLLRSLRSDSVAEFYRELENNGRHGPSGEKYADWLLIEIESDLLVRPVQASIASEMMEPTGGGNAVMQLNMGEGKSSVILPCVSASLADGNRLVRNIVLKPLSDQMFKLLKHKLSGLVNRRIYYLPFSRSLNPDIRCIALIRKIYEECLEKGGILLSLPEHALSMGLMGIDKLTRGSDTAEALVDLQKWVIENSRDILDESDEILHVRYQLIYTVGMQQLPEGGADRWTILQEALDLFHKRAVEYRRLYPEAVEIDGDEEEGARFPTIRVLNDKAGKAIIDGVVDDIFHGRLASVSTQMELLRTKDLARSYVTDIDVKAQIASEIGNSCSSTTFASHLKLLRGLIAHGLLLFVFREKRYRVDYGMDKRRYKKDYNLAVPFRAKDVPATRAEFGQMDVLLALTHLSHYANGLRNEEIRLCFDLLYKTDNPDQVYEDWVGKDPSVPEEFKQRRGVNLENKTQFFGKVCKLLRRNKHLINFYLSSFVFPKQIKEFPEKISANGWDIAQEKPDSGRADPRRFTTGFSGTNDNRYLLPTPIEQKDKPELLHTNAMVLEHLLKPENNKVVHAHIEGKRLRAWQLLDMIVQEEPDAKVLLDVGAQVLEYGNKEVVKQWLKRYSSNIDPSIKGGIFFNDKDELTILNNRHWSTEPFTASSTMSNQMDRYLVYLDEAHTRGTDLKLPTNSRAVVTLGPKLVKDKFIQGCMRMRKLANGHSLVFFAPPEVHNSIIEQTGKSSSDQLKSRDVVLWTMMESCRQLQQSFPNWANQGVQYDKRRNGWINYREDGNIQKLRDATVEPERRSLDDMYAPKYIEGCEDNQISEIKKANQTYILKDINEKCARYDIKSLKSAEAEEEQEREVEQEREQERQVERPPDAVPLKHTVHPDVVKFVRTGRTPLNSPAISPAFRLFNQSSARKFCHPLEWSENLLASKDFLDTVRIAMTDNVDDYIRPVRWILSSKAAPGATIVLISPFEANYFIRDVDKSANVRLHMYNPRVLRTGFLDFEGLDVCLRERWDRNYIAPELTMELNIFAGQLYFRDRHSYESLCAFLGLYFGVIPNGYQLSWIRRGMDGFLNKEARVTLGIQTRGEAKFDSSPIKFIEALMNMRRKGLGYNSSHIGAIVHSRRLQEWDF